MTTLDADEQDRTLAEDLFCCDACGTFWLVERSGDRHPPRKLNGAGCGSCDPGSRTGGGAFAFPTGGLVIDFGVESMRPTGLTPEQYESALSNAADLVSKAPAEVVVNVVADQINTRLWRDSDPGGPPHTALSRLADAIDGVRQAVRGGVKAGVSFVCRMVGAPRLVADLIGECVARATVDRALESLKQASTAIRIVDTIACTAEGRETASAYALAKGLTRTMLNAELREAIASIRGPRAVSRAIGVDRGERPTGIEDDWWSAPPPPLSPGTIPLWPPPNPGQGPGTVDGPGLHGRYRWTQGPGGVSR